MNTQNLAATKNKHIQNVRISKKSRRQKVWTNILGFQKNPDAKKVWTKILGFAKNNPDAKKV